MHRFAVTSRIAIGLALLSASGLLLLNALGFGPRQRHAQLEGRRRTAELIAIDASLLVTRDDTLAVRSLANAVVKRYPDICAVTIRRQGGETIVALGETANKRRHDLQGITLPLVKGTQRWGDVEIQFEPLASAGLAGVVQDPFLQLAVALTLVNLIAFVLYLKKTLQHLDPSRVVPDHVRSAFDTIAAGLVIIDNHERIVLANSEFTQSIGVSQSDLLGRRLNRLGWKYPSDVVDEVLPWAQTLADGSRMTGATLHLADQSGELHAYIVNSAPVLAQNQERRGVLVSFENITELETKKAELSRALTVVQSSRDEIRRQNQRLQRLATQDPLTDCLNRRSFFDGLEEYWQEHAGLRDQISCIMLDIDHFKEVNDSHGHAAGDLVLKHVVQAVQSAVPVDAVVGRYGGEEFCIVLPGLKIDDAECEAESIRLAVAQTSVGKISVTVSIGVSCGGFGADTAQAMVEQADKCLYAAKHNGRNQVVRWDKMPRINKAAKPASEHNQLALKSASHEAAEPGTGRSLDAVNALLAALEYRDRATAKHSRRVATLSVGVGRELMSVEECHVLETAALLHDIGKIGIPDSILRKPGPLTDDERRIMLTHDQLGVEIIAGSIAWPELIRTVQLHHRWYQPREAVADGPVGDAIPVGSRILAVAEAFDSMTSESVYREPLSRDAAIAELRCHAGTQFDPHIVERFVNWVTASRSSDGALPTSVQTPPVTRSTNPAGCRKVEGLSG